MRPLSGRRLDDDVIELPIATAMREAFFGRPHFHDNIESFLQARIGLFEQDREALELRMPIAFADSEIEPALRHQIKCRRLFSEDYWIVPRQHHHRGAEA